MERLTEDPPCGGRVVYYCATSLDGFLADSDGSLGWLLGLDVDNDGPLGFDTFDPTIGSLLMGRATFDWLHAHLAAESVWPHPQPTFVLTSRPLPAPRSGAVLHPVRDDLDRVVGLAREAASGRDVWCVGGGTTATQLARAGLIDEVWLSVAPVTLGSGTPLLGGGVQLELLDVARNRDFAALRYKLRR